MAQLSELLKEPQNKQKKLRIVGDLSANWQHHDRFLTGLQKAIQQIKDCVGIEDEEEEEIQIVEKH